MQVKTTIQTTRFGKMLSVLGVAFGCFMGMATSSVSAAPLRASGKVVSVAKAPRPGSVPYKDAVVAVHMTNVKSVSGKLKAKQILVYTWGMKNNKTMPAASLRKGQSVTLRLTPWDKAERKYGSYNRVELKGSAADDLDAYWGEK